MSDLRAWREHLKFVAEDSMGHSDPTVRAAAYAQITSYDQMIVTMLTSGGSQTKGG